MPQATSASHAGSGVSTAFQDLSLLSNLTVAENLFLPRLGRGRPFVRRRQNEDTAAELLAEFDLPTLSPTQQVGELSLAERQKLEIVRAVSHRPKLLLLDEPSAALPDVEWLYGLIEKISSPELTILYISHRLAEIRDLCRIGHCAAQRRAWSTRSGCRRSTTASSSA